MSVFRSFTCSDALNALYDLEVCITREARTGPVAEVGLLFAVPEGTLYEADSLTWRFYHLLASSIVHAINNKAYGPELADRLFQSLFPRQTRRIVSVDETRQQVGSLRAMLRIK